MSIREGVPAENNDEPQFDIDTEWASLNKDLDRPPELNLEELALQERHDEIADKIFEHFCARGLPRVFDVNKEVERQIRTNYFDEADRNRAEILAQRSAWAPSEMLEIESIQMIKDTMIAFSELQERDLLFLRDLTSLVLLAENAHLSETVAYLSMNNKKHIQARLAVSQGYNLDHPTQKFVDEMTPDIAGLGFAIYTDADGQQEVSVFDENDQHYIEKAKAADYKKKLLNQTKRMKIKRAESIIGLHPYTDENCLTVLNLSAACERMFVVTCEEVYSIEGQAEKTKRLWEIVRQLDYPDAVLGQLVELFEDVDAR